MSASPRFRDWFGPVGALPTGPLNAITDVAGVRVGHVTLISGDGPLVPGRGPIRTGVTAILPHAGDLFRQKVTAAVETINGFGKAAGFEQVRELGQLETPILLTNTLNVGLVAAACVRYCVGQNPDIGIHTTTVNPLVGETNDGYLNDIQGQHVRQEHVWRAITEARGGAVAEGNVGAGTGTQCYGWKGGIGTASRVAGGYVLGALLQTNFGRKSELHILGAPVGHCLGGEQPQTGAGSVMAVLATDAPLDARQLGRLARRVPFALGRTGTVGHHGSGDFVVAFSTAQGAGWRADGPWLDDLFQAAVEAVEEAIYNALVAARTLSGRDGHTLEALPHDALARCLRRYGR